MIDIAISDWRLISVTVDDIGPFRDGMRSFSFMGGGGGDQTDSSGPSSFYMLLARNGHGKTTLLESIHGVLGMLANPPIGRFAEFPSRGAVQLDFRATWTIDGDTKTVLLSMWTGAAEPLVVWDSAKLEDEAEASEWAKLGIFMAGSGLSGYQSSNELGMQLFHAITESAGRLPGTLFGTGPELPTVLLFPADRRLSRSDERRVIEAPYNWVYQPAHTFGSEGETWNGSIDNLLVWLEWLENRQLEDLLKEINPLIFPDGEKLLRPPNRQELTTYVSTSSGEHPLSGLSHGERALLQLFVRIMAHMSRNTIILIDEIEIHLHTRWMNTMFQALKALLQSRPSLSIIFTTHDRELIKVFDHKRIEEKIVKGGYLIANDLD